MNLNPMIARIIPNLIIMPYLESTPIGDYLSLLTDTWYRVFNENCYETNIKCVLPTGWVDVKVGKLHYLDIICSETNMLIINSDSEYVGITYIDGIKELDRNYAVLRHPKLN
jgi:hypothetical protein